MKTELGCFLEKATGIPNSGNQSFSKEEIEDIAYMTHGLSSVLSLFLLESELDVGVSSIFSAGFQIGYEWGMEKSRRERIAGGE